MDSSAEPAVVGVHSGKFINERDTANVARACERLGVRHPAVDDRQFRTWREYAVRAWPTPVVVSPDGYVLHARAAEITAARLAALLREAVEDARVRMRARSGEPRGLFPRGSPPLHTVVSCTPEPQPA